MTAGRRPKYLGHRRFASLGLAAALAVIAALVSSAAAAAPAPKLDWQPCADPAQKGFQCATARVPRNYRHPHRSKIRLAAIRHRATNPEHRVGTLFVNFGGPGASSTDQVASNPGFNWGDAGQGAGAALVLVTALVYGAFTVRNRRQRGLRRPSTA